MFYWLFLKLSSSFSPSLSIHFLARALAIRSFSFRSSSFRSRKLSWRLCGSLLLKADILFLKKDPIIVLRNSSFDETAGSGSLTSCSGCTDCTSSWSYSVFIVCGCFWLIIWRYCFRLRLTLEVLFKCSLLYLSANLVNFNLFIWPPIDYSVSCDFRWWKKLEVVDPMLFWLTSTSVLYRH